MPDNTDNITTSHNPPFWRKSYLWFTTCFEALDKKSGPLSACYATIMERCFIVLAAVWIIFQGVYFYSPTLVPGAVWLAAAVLSSLAALGCSGRLSLNRPQASIFMQLASIIGIGLSLVQGIRLGLVPLHYLWFVPAITLVPALYLGLRRNMEFFALIGYVIALTFPFFSGATHLGAGLFFSYYLVLCLPLPFVTLMRRWRYLNICVLSWVAAAGAYYLVSWYGEDNIRQAQGFFALFMLCYFMIVWARIARAPFSVFRFWDFIFSVGLPLAATACCMRIFMPRPDGVLVAVFSMVLVFFIAGIMGRLTWSRHGKTLSRIYIFISVVLLDSSIAILWPGVTALGIYCAQAVLLFWFGSATGIMRIKAGGFIIFILLPAYFFLTVQHALAGSFFIAISAMCCTYIQNRELKRLSMRSGRHPWSSRLELFFVACAFIWCFGSLAVFSFQHMASPGLVYFALSSGCAYLFFAFGKLIRLRALRVAIFFPILISIPAALLPFIYQAYIEYPSASHLMSYDYLGGIGALAWISYFITVWTGLYHNWGGLISRRLHSVLLAVVLLELVLVVTSSCRAFALGFGVSPALLSSLSVAPSLFCVFVLSRVMKFRNIEQPYRTPMFLVVPWILFVLLAVWYVLALSSTGSIMSGVNYVPLLNPVEMTQAASVLVFAYWQRRLRKSAVPTAYLSSGKVLWVYGVSSFLWLHGVMFRVVQHFSQAEMQDVLQFAELRFIFSCIWLVYGMLVWIGSTSFNSAVSWALGVLAFFAGVAMLLYLSFGIWGQPATVMLGFCALVVLALLVWRSPAPFTQRGKKAAEGTY